MVQMDAIKSFKLFFSGFRDLCFTVCMVEGHRKAFDLSDIEDYENDPNYAKGLTDTLKEATKKYPKAIVFCYVGMNRNGGMIQFYLTESDSVIVEYLGGRGELEKTDEFSTLSEVRRFIPSYINYLTRQWDPLSYPSKKV